MSTSVKLKFLPSKIKDKAGVICLQLIHNRKVRLIRTRFRPFSNEWNIQTDSIVFHSADYERNIFLNSVKNELENELQHLRNLIRMLESQGDYSTDELADHFTNNSMNGCLFSFIDYTVKMLKNNGQTKTATTYITVKQSFARFITDKRAVNEQTIIALKKMYLTHNVNLELTRDLFLFSFYMRGISFVDMANLKADNVRNGYIIYFRSKTKQMLSVRLEPCMQEIIDRYRNRTIDDYLLPVFTLRNRSHTSHLRTYNKRLKRISKMLGLEKPLSSYVARHSWATIALRKKVPIEVISEGMGHENETTTRIYLASIGQYVVDKANAKIIRLV
ncbi:MAG: site-specific integrase [Dysgonamonadaceae bacterium]|jgi:site-specific recombinase XerD|nr:site-specific integrase [Dysgonamonadaceae bacterium]